MRKKSNNKNCNKRMLSVDKQGRVKHVQIKPVTENYSKQSTRLTFSRHKPDTGTEETQGFSQK